MHRKNQFDCDIPFTHAEQENNKPKPDEPEPKRQSLRGAQRRGNPDNFIKGLLNGWIAALRSQ